MGLTLLHSGKVRDVYDAGNGELLLVASDRVSVYDVVLPTPVPDKGAILTQLSLWWFEQLADVVPHHVVPGGLPAGLLEELAALRGGSGGSDGSADGGGHRDPVHRDLARRTVRVRALRMLPVECIARGYLAGLGLEQ
jgi:phosphoribosylaminoimidazole-succinocarboxamide synthase